MTKSGEIVTSHHQKGMDANQKFFRAARDGDLHTVIELLGTGININASHINALNGLHLAAKEGHLHVATELIKRGIKVDSCTQKGNTALHIASLAGHFPIVELLLDHGADVNKQSTVGFTPLYMASQENHVDVVNLLISRGANQSLTTNDGFTPLAVALQQGHDKVVSILLERESKSKATMPALHIATRKDDVNALGLLLNNPDANVNLQSLSGFTPLHIAAHYGKLKAATVLIEREADVNFQAKNNITALHVAAKWGRNAVVKLLIQCSAKVDCRTRDGLTPLHCAARSGIADLAEQLIQSGADPSSVTKNGLTPLHMAAQGNHADVARMLIMHGVSVEDTTGDLLTPLHVAAHCGNVEVARVLIDRRCDTNARALNGFTPLHVACKKGKSQIVELLIKAAAQITATTESGLSPLHVAAFIGQPTQTLQLLLKQGAEVDQRTMRCETPLHLAVRNCQLEAAKILIAHHATVDAKANDDETPLHIAVFTGHVEMVRLLLSTGANPNAPTKDAYTSLHVAAKRGLKEMLQTLLDAGANMEAKNKRGFTPLHIAAKHGQVTCIHMLVYYSGQQKAKCDLNAQARNQLTPLHLAVHYNQLEAVQFLLDKGADTNCRATNGYTLLHVAAKYNHLDIAQLLIAHESDPSKIVDAESKLGFTPLHLACQEGHEDMVSLLVQQHADVKHRAQNGVSPLHLAAQSDKVIVAEILVGSGSEASPRTKAGYTPLHTAAHFGQLAMVKFLLSLSGIQVDEKTNNNCTALHLATQQGHTEVVQLLLDRGANPNLRNKFNLRPVQIAFGEHYLALYDRLRLVTTEITIEEMQVDEQWYASNKERPEFLYEQVVSESEDEHGHRSLRLDDMATSQKNNLPPDQWQKSIVKSSTMQNGHTIAPQHSPASTMGLIQTTQLLEGYHMRPGGALRMSGASDMEANRNVAAADIWNQMEYMRSGQPAGNALASDSFRSTIRGDESMYESKDMTDLMVSKTITDQEAAAVKEGLITGADWLGESDNVDIVRQPITSGFLASFVVDARGGMLKAQRKPDLRFFIPPSAANGPTRLIVRLCRPNSNILPPLNDGDGLACKVIELGPSGVKFLTPILIEIPHCASMGSRNREIVVMRSENGSTWKEHVTDCNDQMIKDSLGDFFPKLMPSSELGKRRIYRIMSYDLPKYFALISRIRQDMILIGPDGGILGSSTVPEVQAMFPQGALTKNIRVGLEAHAIDQELVTRVFGSRVSVSPVVTIEPRRRKFHKAITLTMPLPKETLAQQMQHQQAAVTSSKKQSLAAAKNIIDSPSLRLLCSIMGGVTPAKWEDITGSSALTLSKGCVSFTTTVSARLWLVDCPNLAEVLELSTKLYRLSTAVPYIGRFVVYGRRHHEEEAQIRCMCLIDDSEVKTLECQEGFDLLAAGPNIEVVQNQAYWVETSGNIVPISTVKGKQLHLSVRAFEENRLHTAVRVKTADQLPKGRIAFMREEKLIEPEAKPLTTLEVTLPEEILPIDDPKAMHALLAEIHARREAEAAAAAAAKPSQRRDSADIAKSQLNLKELAIALGPDWVRVAEELGLDAKRYQTTGNQTEAAHAMLLDWKAKSSPGSGTRLSSCLMKIGLSHALKQCMRDIKPVSDEKELNQALRDLHPEMDRDMNRKMNGFHQPQEVTSKPRGADTPTSGIGASLVSPRTLTSGTMVGDDSLIDQTAPIEAKNVAGKDQVKRPDPAEAVTKELVKKEGLHTFEELSSDFTKDVNLTNVGDELTHLERTLIHDVVKEDPIEAHDRRDRPANSIVDQSVLDSFAMDMSEEMAAPAAQQQQQQQPDSSFQASSNTPELYSAAPDAYRDEDLEDATVSTEPTDLLAEHDRKLWRILSSKEEDEHLPVASVQAVLQQQQQQPQQSSGQAVEDQDEDADESQLTSSSQAPATGGGNRKKRRNKNKRGGGGAGGSGQA